MIEQLIIDEECKLAIEKVGNVIKYPQKNEDIKDKELLLRHNNNIMEERQRAEANGIKDNTPRNVISRVETEDGIKAMINQTTYIESNDIENTIEILKNLTQKEIGDIAGVSQATISRR